MEISVVLAILAERNAPRRSRASALPPKRAAPHSWPLPCPGTALYSMWEAVFMLSNCLRAGCIDPGERRGAAAPSPGATTGQAGPPPRRRRLRLQQSGRCVRSISRQWRAPEQERPQQSISRTRRLPRSGVLWPASTGRLHRAGDEIVDASPGRDGHRFVEPMHRAADPKSGRRDRAGRRRRQRDRRASGSPSAHCDRQRHVEAIVDDHARRRVPRVACTTSAASDSRLGRFEITQLP